MLKKKRSILPFFYLYETRFNSKTAEFSIKLDGWMDVKLFMIPTLSISKKLAIHSITLTLA